jgi:hypothetical protein
MDDVETTGTTDIDVRFQTKLKIETNETGGCFAGKGKLNIVAATPDVKVTTGDTAGSVKHLSLRAARPDKAETFVTVLYPGKAPRVDWKEKGSKATLTVNGDRHEFTHTSAGWLPRKIDGEKVPKPEAPQDRTLEPAK